MRLPRITSGGYAYGVLERLKGFGLQVRKEGPFPHFPHGFNPSFIRDCGGMGDVMHVCEGEPVPPFQGVLVFDVVVQADGGCRFAATNYFTPFYVGDLLMTHDGSTPDLMIWAPANSLIAVNALAQHPALGSFRFSSPHTPSGRAQAFLSPDKRKIVVTEGGSAYGHHMLWARQDVAHLLPSTSSYGGS
ncbi:hypothetical protein HZA87_03680 [Candidatus Uhrbacteria bacterium]|nr:hypothetical protein [Candidatus Uhrbacteria bacterium]